MLFRSIFANPLHPYTRGLMKSVPQLDGDRSEKLHVIKGTVPSLENVPEGCRFATRCEFATDKCIEQAPDLREFDNGQKARCWHVEDILKREEELKGEATVSE